MDTDKVIIVDCSHWNENLDCSTLAENGVSGIILKATQDGSQIDPKFGERLPAAQAAGLLTGAYHWLDPTVSGARQAEFFLSNRQNAGLLALDLEQYWTDWNDRRNPRKRLPAAQIAACAREWLKVVEDATQQKPVIYTGVWFVNAYLSGHSAWLQDYPLWLAQYIYAKTPPVICDWQTLNSRYLPKTSGPSLPPGCRSWALWQFTGDKFTLPGSTSRLNVNLANGTLAEVRAFFHQSQPTLAEMVQALWAAHPQLNQGSEV